MNYYERHIGDYLKDTAHLSLLEHGVYSRLLDVYYTREGAIPVDQVERLIGARSKDERAALAAVLDEFFTAAEGHLHHTRCEREIARFQDKQRKAKASAEARWSQRQPQSECNANADAEGMRTHMRTHSEGNAPRARPQTPDTRLHSVAELPHGGEVAKPTAAATAAPTTRGCRLPKDWSPGEEQRAFAATLGLVNGRFDAEVEKFRDYWTAQPGQKGVKADWTATLRNWLRRAAEEGRGKAPAAQGDLMDGVH